MSEERQTLIASLRTKAEDAVSESLRKQLDTGLFTKEMLRELKERQGDVVWKLLGLDNRWGKWEVDHCNGRTSPITNYLTEATRGVVESWINEAVTEVLTENGEKLRALAKKAVQKEVRENLERRIQRHAYEVMDKRAAAIASEIVEQAMSEVRAEAVA